MDDLASNNFVARLGRSELGRILDLKGNLNYSEVLVEYAGRYQTLGWEVLPLNGRDQAAPVDFSQPPEVWVRYVTDLGLEGIQIKLAIRTGAPSGLMVLEVKPEEETPLEALGPWRAGCTARVGWDREHHYYALPRDCHLPSFCLLDASGIAVYADGGLVLAPPSVDPETQEPLRWLAPPWERSVSEPPPAVWQFLKKHIAVAHPQPAATAEALLAETRTTRGRRSPPCKTSAADWRNLSCAWPA